MVLVNISGTVLSFKVCFKQSVLFKAYLCGIVSGRFFFFLLLMVLVNCKRILLNIHCCQIWKLSIEIIQGALPAQMLIFQWYCNHHQWQNYCHNSMDLVPRDDEWWAERSSPLCVLGSMAWHGMEWHQVLTSGSPLQYSSPMSAQCILVFFPLTNPPASHSSPPPSHRAFLQNILAPHSASLHSPLALHRTSIAPCRAPKYAPVLYPQIPRTFWWTPNTP